MILLEALKKLLCQCRVCGSNALKGKPCLNCGAREVPVVKLEVDTLGLPVVK
jgi:hypothetical protein